MRVVKSSGRVSARVYVSGSIRRRLDPSRRGTSPPGGRPAPGCVLEAALRLREDNLTMVSKRCLARTPKVVVASENELRGHQLPVRASNTMLALLAWARARPLRVSGASPAVAMTPCVVGAPPSARYQLPTHICMRTPRGVRLGKIPHFHPPTHAAARRRPPRIALIPVHPPTHASHRSLPPAAPRSRPASVGDRHRRRRRRDPEVRQLQAQEGG